MVWRGGLRRPLPEVAGGTKSSRRLSFDEDLFQHGTILLSGHWHGPVMKEYGSKKSLSSQTRQ